MSEKAVQFVQIVGKYPCLYNNTLPEYLRKDCVEASWIEVAEQIGWAVSDCKEKWRNLRNGLVRRLKSKKRYYLYEHMKFVLKFLKPFQNVDVKDNKYLSNADQYDEDTKDVDVKDNRYLSNTDQFDEDTKDIFEGIYAEEEEEECTSFDPILDTPEKEEIPIVKTKKRRMEEDEVRYLADAPQMKMPKPSESTKRERRENYREMFFLSLMPDVEQLTDENFMQFRINTIVDLQRLLLQQTQSMQSTEANKEDDDP